ncbi:MAG: DUF3883 domain-containing protein [Saprospiraceae bacterium]|nr:DUF3883 domain-containing protein [Saprospiraceae bacterium]
MNNIKIGLGGELYVLAHEKENLINRGRKDLAEKVLHVSKLFGDKMGYDVLSFDFKGNPKWIEVKTTSGEISDDFYISENEYNTMIKNRQKYFIYRVYGFSIENKSGQIKEIKCSTELDKLKIDVSILKVKPNKYYNK